MSTKTATWRVIIKFRFRCGDATQGGGDRAWRISRRKKSRTGCWRCKKRHGLCHVLVIELKFESSADECLKYHGYERRRNDEGRRLSGLHRKLLRLVTGNPASIPFSSKLLKCKVNFFTRGREVPPLDRRISRAVYICR